MADQWEPQTSPRLAGYESWLYQMPRMDSAGDVFVCVPLPVHADRSGELSTRWLVVLGDFGGSCEVRSRLKDLMEEEIGRLAGTVTNPASILEALNNNLLDPDNFACLLVALIDGNRHEMTLANAGHLWPLLRHVDRQTELIGQEKTAMPLWIDPSQTYENVTVPIGPGEIVIFHSDGITVVMDNQHNLFCLDRLRYAIAQAPVGAAPVGQSILEAIRRFGRGQYQFDDITLLCLGRQRL
jgi:phosphoserine phosphatase RsbU/P